jgi:hypothetical protein
MALLVVVLTLTTLTTRSSTTTQTNFLDPTATVRRYSYRRRPTAAGAFGRRCSGFPGSLL